MLTADQIEAAGRALAQAIAEDIDAAARTVVAISKNDPDALPPVMLAWIDTTLATCGAPAEGANGGLVGLRYGNTAAGDPAVRSADEVRPGVRWAGQLIAARFADDRGTFAALLEVARCSPDRGRYVIELLGMCAATIREVRAGTVPSIVRTIDVGDFDIPGGVG